MKRTLLLLASTAFLVAACSSTTTSPGVIGTPDAGAPAVEEEDAGAASGGTQCSAARKTHLVPIAKVSTGEVKVISTEGGVTTLYVDAAAGGTIEAASNPRVYIKLHQPESATPARVDIDDNEAFTSTEWDLALKRVDIYTNSGDAGLGKGGAAKVSKDFDDVTAADADKAKIAVEKFFDDECNGLKDEASFIITTFRGWYDYEVGGGPAVHPNTTFIVRGADGTSRYKVGIVSYTAKSDGSTNGQATGRFLLKVAPL